MMGNEVQSVMTLPSLWKFIHWFRCYSGERDMQTGYHKPIFAYEIRKIG